ncbi:inositol monophosphatase family protein [Sinomonas halotolerans]|uniref:inositol-phosphate phosphatase n=1 Tax=Sinomonas halotolerans TaxID=1644133 RepID=A0ABU9X1W8_9MICC
MTEVHAILRAAKAAARAAAPIALRGWGQAPGQAKGGRHDLVTEFDVASQDIISGVLLSAFPESSVIGEEEPVAPTSGLDWHVDPIDGTTNFVSGLPLWCISIGASLDGELVAGVVYDPVRDEMFTATRTEARLNGAPIRAGGSQHAAGAVVACDWPDPRIPLWGADEVRAREAYDRMLSSFLAVRRIGSGALGLAYVAAGRLDAAVGILSNSWDVAAGRLLLEAAGGRFHPFGPATEHPVGWASERYVASTAQLDLKATPLSDLMELL